MKACEVGPEAARDLLRGPVGVVCHQDKHGVGQLLLEHLHCTQEVVPPQMLHSGTNLKGKEDEEKQ